MVTIADFFCLDFNNYESPWIGGGPPGYGMRNGPGGMGMKPYGGHNWNGNMGGDRGSGGMHCVHMRGLPFKATQQDVADVRKNRNHFKQFI